MKRVINCSSVVDVEQAASQLDVGLDLEVEGVLGVEAIRQEEFVSTEARARLQQAKDLTIDTEFVRCMAKRLDGKDRVKEPSGASKEVAVQNYGQMRQLVLRRVFGAFELIGIAEPTLAPERAISVTARQRRSRGRRRPSRVRARVPAPDSARDEQARKLSPGTRGAK